MWLQQQAAQSESHTQLVPRTNPFSFFFCAVFCVSIFLNRSISSSFSFLITCVLCTSCVRLSCYWLFSDDAQVFVTVRQYWPLCLNVVGAGWPDVPVFQGQAPFSVELSLKMSSFLTVQNKNNINKIIFHLKRNTGQQKGKRGERLDWKKSEGNVKIWILTFPIYYSKLCFW